MMPMDLKVDSVVGVGNSAGGQVTSALRFAQDDKSFAQGDKSFAQGDKNFAQGDKNGDAAR